LQICKCGDGEICDLAKFDDARSLVFSLSFAAPRHKHSPHFQKSNLALAHTANQDARKPISDLTDSDTSHSQSTVKPLKPAPKRGFGQACQKASKAVAAQCASL
jgi:hypothetical protein